jgi:DNA-directed RNA polymerase specialized sigma24 family protein
MRKDVVQTLFLQLLRRGFPREFDKNPKGYLYRAAINLSLNAVKSRRRNDSVIDPTRSIWPAPLPRSRRRRPEDDLQARLVESDSPSSVLARLKCSFSSTSTAPARPRFGRLLGTSRAVVAVTLFRARARLKKLLRTSSGDES